jgi:hypothetical protein
MALELLGGGGSGVQLGGDLGGTTAAPTVAKIQGTTISAPPGGSTAFLRGDGTWVAPSGGGIPGVTVTGTPTTGEALVATSTSTATWTVTGTVDTTDIPAAPTASPTPGTGANGVSASDHAHGLPTIAQLQAVGVSVPSGVPLWAQLPNGEITLPRGHQDDSGSYGQTVASGTVHYTYFIAQQSRSVGHIKFGSGGTAQTTGTYMDVGLYTVNTSTGALTQVATGTALTTTQGSYGAFTFAMGTAYSITAGTLYAVGFLQVAATPASLLGGWFNFDSQDTTPLAYTGATGLTALPATGTAPTNKNAFPVYYEMTA